MTTLAQRLSTLMAQKGLSQAELARIIGVKQPSIFKILNGQTLHPKNIVEIATALGVDVNWLKTGEGESEPNSRVVKTLYTEQQDNQHHLRVDLLDVQLAAHSSGIINHEYPDVLSRLYFTQEGVQRLLGRTTTIGVYIFKVPTDSMQPTITPNDLVFIDTNVKSYIGEGVYAFNLNGETYIKRLQRLPTGVLRALSDNPLYPPFEITDELFDTAQIIGKFLAVLPFNPKLL